MTTDLAATESGTTLSIDPTEEATQLLREVAFKVRPDEEQEEVKAQAAQKLLEELAPILQATLQVEVTIAPGSCTVALPNLRNSVRAVYTLGRIVLMGEQIGANIEYSPRLGTWVPDAESKCKTALGEIATTLGQAILRRYRIRAR